MPSPWLFGWLGLPSGYPCLRSRDCFSPIPPGLSTTPPIKAVPPRTAAPAMASALSGPQLHHPSSCPFSPKGGNSFPSLLDFGCLNRYVCFLNPDRTSVNIPSIKSLYLNHLRELCNLLGPCPPLIQCVCLSCCGLQSKQFKYH